MKKLKDYSDEINRCSKCGLCQSVCPIYKLTGNDCAVSRGKFVMLDGVIKGDLELNQNINKYLEMCLKCDKCSKFCPGGINVCEIFRTAKYEYISNKFEGKLVKFVQSEHIFDKILSLTEKFRPQDKLPIKSEAIKTLLFFKGCANKLFPSGEKSVKKIFRNLNYNIIEEDFKCCGVPFASSGNLERFESVQKYNSDLINKTICDYVVTDCASCQNSIGNYENLNKKILNFVEFFADENIKFNFKNKHKVTFHKPCHLNNYDSVKKLLSNCTNIEYIEMEDFDNCCGFAGQFALTNFSYSKELSKQKIKNALKTNADIILTACPACVLGLNFGMISNGKLMRKPKIMNITEFLADAETITA